LTDVVDNMRKDFPYYTLKARLLETHMLSDQEKLDVLFKFEPLGDCELSQLLVSVLAYCPEDHAERAGAQTVKKLAVFPSPAGMSLTKLSLGGNN
jgi:hypothetical protein